MFILWVIKLIGEFVFFLLEMHKVTGDGDKGVVNWQKHLPISRVSGTKGHRQMKYLKPYLRLPQM